MRKDIEKMSDSDLGSGVRSDPRDINNLEKKGVASEGKWPKLFWSKMYRQEIGNPSHSHSLRCDSYSLLSIIGSVVLGTLGLRMAVARS
jgi:hypothetical protein